MNDTVASGNASPANSTRWQTAMKVAVFLAVVVALIMLGKQAGGYVTQFAQWVESLGALGPVVFVFGYAIAAIAFLPGSILTLAGGAIFGFWGVLWVFLGATLGAAGAFLIARYAARKAIEKKIEGNQRFAAIDRAVAQQGLKIVFLLRLSPAFPFSLMNYALGLTKVRFFDYLIASLGMIPGTFLYVYYGKAAGDLASAASGAGVEKGAEQWVFMGIGLLATVVVTAFVTKIARKALKEAADV